MLYTLLAWSFVSHLNDTPTPDSFQESGAVFWGCLTALVRQPFFDTPGGTRKGGLAEGKVTKCPVDTLLARGRVPPVSDASRRDVDETGTGLMPKSVGMVHLFQKSYKNTHTKKGLAFFEKMWYYTLALERSVMRQ